MEPALTLLHPTPCHPIDEEDDVPGLLEHQSLEDLEHGFGQKARLAREPEGAESQKRIQTLKVR
jgi:hypothetical protein